MPYIIVARDFPGERTLKDDSLNKPKQKYVLFLHRRSSTPSIDFHGYIVLIVQGLGFITFHIEQIARLKNEFKGFKRGSFL